MRKIFAIYCLLLSSFAYSQEVLSPMTFNPRLYYPAVQHGRVINSTDRLRPKSLVQDSILLEETDTLTLPFIDDFSQNKLKPYDFNSYIYGSIINAFGPCDTFMRVRTLTDTFSLTPTYVKSFDTAHQQVDSVANAPIKFYYYPGISPLDGNCFNQVGDSITLYPKGYIYTFDSLYGRILTQIEDTSTLDTPITYAPVIYRSRLPQGTLWVDNFAYHNYTAAYLPPTIGVATLDGLNEYGQPYNPNSAASFGVADYLTSKPIDLSPTFTRADSFVYLSFFYQPGGFGDVPTLGDRLCVAFLNSYSNQWDTVWSVEGDSVFHTSPDSFRQVFIKIEVNRLPDRGYFFNGFQFRFLNYGSLAGNNDIWNIDYVRLDKNRDTTIQNRDISDIAFQYQFPSILKNYEEMPAWQYQDSTDLIDTLNLPIANLNSTQAATNPPATNRTIVANQLYPAAAQLYTSTGVFNASAENVTTLLPSTEYIGITPGPDSMVIRSTAAIDVQNILKANDTISRDQTLTNMLAYDDGTAEAAYGLQNLDLKKFGYEFILHQPDTIVGFQVMYSHIDVNVHDLVFQFNVWDSIKLDDVFFSDSAYTKWTSNNEIPLYIDSVNGFATYRIDPLPVPTKFYFGWAQTDTRNLQIGYDLNSTKGRKHMFIYTSGAWHASTIGTDGSPMIRLLMRHSNQHDSGIKDLITRSVKVYPNPTIGNLTFDLPEGDGSYHIELYSTLGQLCYSNTLTGGNNQIDISTLHQGMYMLRLTDSKTGVTYQNKIVKE